MSTAIRAKLVRLYYELCLVPGLEPRIVRSWADMISRLICSKADQRRRLEASDLQLPWEPLWRVMQKELWPKKRLQESSYVYQCEYLLGIITYDLFVDGTWSTFFFTLLNIAAYTTLLKNSLICFLHSYQ